MMAKYRKKPVEVEEIQVRWENWEDLCRFKHTREINSLFLIAERSGVMG